MPRCVSAMKLFLFLGSRLQTDADSSRSPGQAVEHTAYSACDCSTCPAGHRARRGADTFAADSASDSTSDGPGDRSVAGAVGDIVQHARPGATARVIMAQPELVKVFESSGCLVLGGDRGLPVGVRFVGGLIDPGGVG